VAALLWLPASAHCQLEFLAGIELLQCAGSTPCHSEPAAPDGACCPVEKSQYNPDRARLEIPCPELTPDLGHSIKPERLFEAHPIVPLDPAPPELRRVWHIMNRAALPPRPPSAS
jgi:hypothetical protein